MKILQSIHEAEAIGEFLKNEFYQAEYNRDRDRFEEIVLQPDYNDAGENAFRRALLYRRRGHMWRELPRDTKWFEVEIEPEDLRRVRVFPRAQWRRMSNGNFGIEDIVERIRKTGYRNGGDGVTIIEHLIARHAVDEDVVHALIAIGEIGEIGAGDHRLDAG